MRGLSLTIFKTRKIQKPINNLLDEVESGLGTREPIATRHASSTSSMKIIKFDVYYTNLVQIPGNYQNREISKFKKLCDGSVVKVTAPNYCTK